MRSAQLHLWPGLTGDLTWSLSRDKRLRDCLRKYYLQHYLSREGRAPDAPQDLRELYILKHLKSRHMWVGEVVHHLIETALWAWRRGEEVPADALVERGTRRMRAHYAESMQGVYRERPGRACGLIEHEYRVPVAREEWRELRDRMERSVRNFFSLTLTRDIREAPAWRWLAVEQLASFVLDGATVLVKPDFAHRHDTGGVTMIDWKTGRLAEGEGRTQLAVYGLYARAAWGLPEGDLAGKLVFLDSAEVRDVRLGAADLAGAEAHIRSSVTEMRRLAGSMDARPDLERFPMTQNLKLCARCHFRRACQRE